MEDTRHTHSPTKLGHTHDISPTTVASFHVSLRSAKNNESKHIVSGMANLMFGVESDEITIGFETKRSSALDTNIRMEEAKVNIPAAEHMIRALITLVQHAKKNEIDKPSMFGTQYGPLALTSKQEEEK